VSLRIGCDDKRCRIADRLGLYLGQRDLLTPPAGLFRDSDRIDGSRDVREFVTIGEATVSWLIGQGLKPGHPNGTIPGHEYVFPFDEHQFDFVFLTSVFTHMLPKDTEHYLGEIARVMAPGATCVSSFSMTRTPLGPPLHRYSDVCEVHDLAEPEHGVVYLERYVRQCLDAHGLRIQRLWRGSKYGHDDPEHNRDSEQDLVIATED
jgi:hypothetical protein